MLRLNKIINIYENQKKSTSSSSYVNVLELRLFVVEIKVLMAVLLTLLYMKRVSGPKCDFNQYEGHIP